MPIDNNVWMMLGFGLIGAYVLWSVLKPSRKLRERPDDALQKLVADLKLSAKVNKEPHVKWIKFQGDRKVLIKKRFKVKGYIPDPRLFIVTVRTGLLPLTRVIGIPTELSTFLNSREISVRARGIQRWNGLIWTVVLTERDQANAVHFEDIIQDYLVYAMHTMFRIELRNISFGNYHESAAGAEYADFMRRSERMPAAPPQQGPTPKEEGT
jgi:hypothetical protein